MFQADFIQEGAFQALTVRIINGRAAVGVYRSDHLDLYTGGWYPGIDEAHTPLLNTLLSSLQAQGYNSLDDFFSASETVGDGWL